MNEQEEFLKDLEIKPENDILEESLIPQEEEKKEEDEDSEQHLRNRREKRLAAKLQAEREAGIQMAAKLSVYTEAQKLKGDIDEDYLKGVEKIYGSETPEAIAATELLKNALKGMGDKATERALSQFREEQRQASEQVVKEEEELDSMLEELEDEHGIDLTSKKSEATRKGFFTLLEKMSPKDKEGNVIQYADHHAVWEVYQSKSQKTENPAKALAARAMTQSGASKDSKLMDDSQARQLHELGII